MQSSPWAWCIVIPVHVFVRCTVLGIYLCELNDDVYFRFDFISFAVPHILAHTFLRDTPTTAYCCKTTCSRFENNVTHKKTTLDSKILFAMVTFHRVWDNILFAVAISYACVSASQLGGNSFGFLFSLLKLFIFFSHISIPVWKTARSVMRIQLAQSFGRTTPLPNNRVAFSPMRIY